MNYVNTYKFYDKQGRRLSAFCQYTSPTTAEIFILTCSKFDNFNKKFARNKYLEYIHTGKIIDCKPLIVNVEVLPEQGTLDILLTYMRNEYYILLDVPIDVKILYSLSNKILDNE